VVSGKFSLWPNDSRDPAELLEQGRGAESTGWHDMGLAGHYLPNTGDTPPARGDTHHCWGNLGPGKSERADKLARIKTEVFDHLPG